MKIEHLHIDGFGHFNEKSFGPLDSNLVVFHGANEAGKSTLHNFLRTILFGFGRSNSWLAPVPVLAGGHHGGRVVVVGTDGGRYTIERHAGTRGGTVVVTMPDGSTGGQAELDRLLGIPLEVYCNVFSFDLQQLFEESSLEREDIKTHLYGAGMGVENLTAALERLDQRMDEIYLASGRGRSRRVTDLVKRISEIDRQLVVARREAESWHEHQRRLDEIAGEIEQLQQQREQVTSERRKLQVVLEALDDWDVLQDERARLELLPEMTAFPENGPARLEALETALASAQQEEQRVHRRLVEIREALEEPVADAALAGQREEIEHLREELGGFAERVEREARLGQDIATIQQQIAASLSEIGAGWTVDQALALDISVAEREEIATHRQSLVTATSTLQQARHRLESAAIEKERAETALSTAEGQLKARQAIATSMPELHSLQQRVRQAREAQQDLRTARAQYDQHRQMLAASSQTAGRQNGGTGALIAGGILTLFGMLIALVGLLSSQMAGLITGLLVAAVGVVILVFGQRSSSRRNAGGVDEQSRRITAQLEAATARAHETLSRLPLDDPARPDSSLDALQERIDSAIRLVEQVDRAHEEVRIRQDSLDRAQARVNQEQQALDDASARWRGWLTARSLRENISPDMADAVLDRAGRIRSDHYRLEQMQSERAELAARIAAFAERHRRVTVAIGEPSTVPLSDLAAATRLLVERYDTAREALAQRAHQEADLASIQREHQERQADLAVAGQRLQTLLELGGATDPEAFRIRARKAFERREAERRIADVEARLRRRIPEGQGWPEFLAVLEQADAGSVERAIGDFSASIEQIEQSIASLQDERGSVRQKMSSLENDQTAGELRVERAQLEDQLAEDALEWASYAIAREILLRARTRYEEERQPAVLQTAERVFCQLTGGRYTGVMSRVGSNEIEVVRADARRLKLPELSRGTREQLLLALRFGLIASFGQTSAHLPVIVDDVLVNFDPQRARAAAHAFADLSATNQVLVFTCHQSTVDHLQNAMPQARIVNLVPPQA